MPTETEFERRAREFLEAEFARTAKAGHAPDFRPSAWDCALRAIAAALQAQQPVQAQSAFKSYVHERLDAMGVPPFVASPHTDAGCRVGGRLDWIEQRLPQQPGAQAVVAWRYRHGPRCTNWQDGQPPPEVLKEGYPYQLAYSGQPPSIPEPSEDDVEVSYGDFLVARGMNRDRIREILTTYTARLRERIGGGV